MDDREHAGFTTGRPWIKAAPNYARINVKEALADNDSVLHHYRQLFRLRKAYDIITHGDYQLILEEHLQIFAYVRRFRNERLLVINNFYGRETVFQLPPHLDFANHQIEPLISNYSDSPERFDHITLRPYESMVYHVVTD